MVSARVALGRKLTIGAIVVPLLISACATRATAFEVKVGNGSPFAGLKVDGSIIDVTLTNTGWRAAKRVSLTCQFFDEGGAAVVTGAAYFNNLGAGRQSTNRVILATPGVVRGDCALR